MKFRNITVHKGFRFETKQILDFKTNIQTFNTFNIQTALGAKFFDFQSMLLKKKPLII